MPPDKPYKQIPKPEKADVPGNAGACVHVIFAGKLTKLWINANEKHNE